MTKLRREAANDEAILAKAKAAMVDALDSKDEKRRFEAAKALYSYRAQTVPTELHERGEYTGPLNENGSRPTSLADVLTFGLVANESTRAVIEDAIAEARSRASAHPPYAAAQRDSGSQFKPDRLGLEGRHARAAMPTPSAVSLESRSSESGHRGCV